MGLFRRKPKMIDVEVILGVRAEYSVKLNEDGTWTGDATFILTIREADAPFDKPVDVVAGEWWNSVTGYIAWYDRSEVTATTADGETVTFRLDNEILKAWDYFLKPYHDTIEADCVRTAISKFRASTVEEIDRRVDFWDEIDAMFERGRFNPVKIGTVTATTEAP